MPPALPTPKRRVGEREAEIKTNGNDFCERKILLLTENRAFDWEECVKEFYYAPPPKLTIKIEFAVW